MKAIFATDLNGGMGIKGKLPWPKLDGDFSFFKAITIDETIVMGRKTYDSIKEVLPRRDHIVITAVPEVLIRDNEVRCIPRVKFCTLKEYLSTLSRPKHFIIGGAEILNNILFDQYVDEIYWTEIRSTYKCDANLDLSFVEKYNFINIATKIQNPDTEHITYTIKKGTLK